MRRLSFNLTVAVLAFVVGVSTAFVFGKVFGAGKRRAAAVRVETWSEPPPPPRKSCRGALRELPPSPPVVMVMPTMPEAPGAPEPPQPPSASRRSKQTRVIIRRDDGSVRVIETPDGRVRKF